MKKNPILFYNRYSKKMEEEKVYGGAFVDLLYKTKIGQKFITPALANRFVGQVCGLYQDAPASRKNIAKFIDQYKINMDDYLPQEGLESNNGAPAYRSFNQFFIRRFKKGLRPFVQEQDQMPAFAEARYFGFSETGPNDSYPIKNFQVKIAPLLDHPKWSNYFTGGPMLLARLCPVDYHRFHFPDHGKIIDHYQRQGPFHSVNPVALKFKDDILMTNERQVSILETQNFGRLAYIEVGALCVGRIVQSHDFERTHKRGEEKGYFLFGGSTVIVIGEKGLWKPTDDILKHTKRNIETYVHLGDHVATK